MLRLSSRSSIQTVWLYALLGGAWILLTDQLLVWLLTDAILLTIWQTYKGWFFVLASTLLLYVLLARADDRHQQTQKALKTSAATYRLLFESNPLPMWVYDLETLTFLAVNTAAVEKYGYTRAQFLTMTLRDIRPAEDIDRLLENVAHTTERLTFSGEWRHRRQDGAIFPVEIVSHGLTYNGHAARLVVANDISERKRAENQLRRSEAVLKKAQQFAHVGSWVWNLKTNQLEWSDEMYRIYGLDKKINTQSLPEVILQTVHPDDRALVEQSNRSITNNKKPIPFEYRIVRPDQSVRFVWAEAGEMTVDEEGNSSLLMGTAQDTTARRQVEEALRQRVAELEALHTASSALRLAQTSDDVLPILLDKALAALDAGDGAIWLHHAGSDESRIATAQGLYRQRQDRALKPGEEMEGSVFDAGQTYSSDETACSPDEGTPQKTVAQAPGQPDHSRAWVPIWAGSERIGILVISVPHPRRLAPEQVKLLEALSEMAGETLYRLRLWQETQEQTRRIQGIMDTAPTGMILLDGDGHILLANPVAMQALSTLCESGEGEAQVDLKQPLTHLGNRSTAELLSAPSHEGWYEVQAGANTFEIIAQPMTGDQHPRHWVLIINDVTQAHQQQIYEQVQERLATVGQLAAGIAHDFNNIMGAIVLYAGMLRKASNLSGQQQRQLDAIYSQAEHATNLIRQILDFSRRTPMTRAPIDLLPQVKELVKLWQRTLPENIHLKLAYDQGESIVVGDPTRLQQVLMNLVLNARDAMPNGGQITISLSTVSLTKGQPAVLSDRQTEVGNDYLSLTVADTGTGIPPETLPHVFDPFFTTKEPGKGTGLGLAQVYGIVAQHDGIIDVQSKVGKGTTFTLYLPHYTTPNTTQSSPVDRAPVDLPANGQGETILLVEDNVALQAALVEMLEAANYRLLTAENGVKALEILAARNGVVDLVISDLIMPQMGGLALRQRLRDMYPAIKILFMTGYTPQDDVHETLRKEAETETETWLQKPFAAADLIAQVQAMLAT